MKFYPQKVTQEDLDPWPFDNPNSQYKILRGNPQARGRFDLGGPGETHRLGIWACSEGAFECIEQGEELQTLLEGRLRLEREDGSEYFFAPGDSFFTRPGERLVWDIIEDVKKVFFTYDAKANN
ncbi:MAG: cupin domain-containing protein [Pseudomonadota bacterium]